MTVVLRPWESSGGIETRDIRRRKCRPRRLASGGGAQRLGRGAQLLLPLERVAARLAREAELGVGRDHLHLLLLLLHDGPRGVGAVGRLVAARLARVAAVGITHAAVEVALERVEVLVVARLLWVPRLEDGLLGINAPDVAKL